MSTVIGTILGVIGLMAIIILFAGWITQLLWNVLLPDLFNFPMLSYWQAVGIYILAGIFRGSNTYNSSK
jgi:hypothetical protein